ncbi:hypothetical protein Aperf_G00000098233 [Anoplocephala perfoliata]
MSRQGHSLGQLVIGAHGGDFRRLGSANLQKIVVIANRQQIEHMLAQSDENTSEDYVKYESGEDDEESSSEESPEDLPERIKDIDLTADNIDVDKVWSLLSPKEKRDFHRQIATGSIYSSVPVWTPWWQSTSRKLVTSFPDDFIEESVSKASGYETCPLSKLISKEPHPSIIFSLAETLLGYVFTARYFNGEHLKDMRKEAYDLLLKLVSYLHPKQITRDNSKTRVIKASTTKMIIFSTFSEVIASLQSRLAQSRLACSHKLLLLLTDDLYCLLQNFDSFVSRALDELMDVFSNAESTEAEAASVRHKLKFLRACTGKRDEASVKWCEKNISALLKVVETSICEQTVRIETEKAQIDPNPAKKKGYAGPHWQNIIRDNPSQKTGQLIEEINLPNVSDSDT